MASDFSVDLGHGWHLASDGTISSSPIPKGSVYKPSSLPFTYAEARDALSQFAGIFPKEDDESRKPFKNLGLSDGQIDILTVVGKAGKTLSSFFAYAAIVQGLVNLVIGSNGIDPNLEKVASELRGFVKAEAHARRIERIAEIRSVLGPALNAVRAFITELQSYYPDPQRLEQRLQDMRAVHQAVAQAVAFATDTASWMTPFDPNDHMLYLLHRLRLSPEGGGDVGVAIPNEGDLLYDHSFAIPIIIYAITSYIAVIKAVLPEFRTVGQYQDNLRTFARNIESVCSVMRARGLARVSFEPSDFVSRWSNEDHETSNVNPIFSRFTVGAIDLIAYTNEFVGQPLDTQTILDATFYKKATIAFGQMQVLWRPTSPYVFTEENHEFGNRSGWIYFDDPEKCAEEANAVGKRAYDELLVTGGYLALVHQAAMLKHLSTEADTSETVTGKIKFARQHATSATISVSSPDIPYTGIIKTSGRLVKQRFLAKARFTTQPPDHQIAIPYRILLRSLKLKERHIEGVLDQNYDDYYATYYVVDPDVPGFKKLMVTTVPESLLGEVLLFSGTTPKMEIRESGVASIQAGTFDWYIPEQPFERDAHFLPPASVLPGLGTVHFHPGGPSSPWDDFEPVASAMVGERRNLRTEVCDVNWQLSWAADGLSVEIEVDSNCRNCIVNVVVEERLVSGQALQTPLVAPINTQLTFVPPSFLKEEDAAWVYASIINHDLAKQFVTRSPVNPGDPIIRFLEPGTQVTRTAIAQMAGHLGRLAPELVVEASQRHK